MQKFYTIDVFKRFKGILFVFSFLPVKAQKNLEHDGQYWIRYYNQTTFNKGISWHSEIESRHSFETNKQQQFVVHTRLHRA